MTTEAMIRQQGEFLGYELTDWDIEQIKEAKFHIIVLGGEVTIRNVRSAIRLYFA